MQFRIPTHALAAVACVIGFVSVGHAAPQPSSFTYQGRLTDAGGPVDTTVNATFRLFDAQVGGSQIGADIVRIVTPDDGVFSETLDFGLSPWANGDQLWLEIEIDGDMLGRQALEGAPFAQRTRGINVNELGQVGIGTTTPEGLLHLADTGSVILRMEADTDNLVEEDQPRIEMSQDNGLVEAQIGFSNGLNTFYIAASGVQVDPPIVLDTLGGVGIGIQSALQGDLHVAGVEDDGTAIRARHTGTGLTIGVESTVDSGYGVYGEVTNTTGAQFGVYGQSLSSSGWGIFSNGRMAATGTKSFCIDHPLDPANAYLLHYSSEAPEPLNTYSGTVLLDHTGQAIVALPDYFEAINTDFRYQLTAIGASAPGLYIASEVANNRFAIAGGLPGLKVSWEVTARRNDAFVRAAGAPVELSKPAADRGRYLMPELHGAPSEQAIHARPGYNKTKSLQESR